MSRGRIINVAHRNVRPGGRVKRKECQPSTRSVLFRESLSGFLREPLRIGMESKMLSANGLMLKGERLVVGENATPYL